MVERVYLTVMGLIMAGAGIFALIVPGTVAGVLGIAAFGAEGNIELRAVYGGLPLGWGLLLLSGLRFRVLALSGLAFTVFGGGCLLLARFLTALFFGSAGFSGVVTSLILFEVVMVGFAYALLRQSLHSGELPEVVR